MISTWKRLLRGTAFAALLLSVTPAVRAEYLRIELRVYGLDCGLCARGVAASVQRMAGVKSVDINLEQGTVLLVLVRGNSFKLSGLRTRIRENGFRPMGATITAVGQFNGSKFEVLGSGESFELAGHGSPPAAPVEVTFEAR